MQRAKVYFLVVPVLFTLSLSGCGLLGPQEKPEVDLTEIFPRDLPSIGQVRRLNVDGGAKSEWLVFYHVDLVEDNLEGSPTIAAVYRPVTDQDSRVPPRLIPALLWLPRQGYLCLHTCEAEMRDVISGDPKGDELLILDKHGDETVGAAIFRWQKDLVAKEGQVPGGFVPLGHFRADSINVEKDKVTVIRKQHDRSDLATREIYEPESGRYYFKEARHVDDPQGRLRSPQEAEIIFASGLPEKPGQVKLPEKLVLAFYQNFSNLDETKSYVTPAAWERMGQGCPENVCGCSSKQEDVSRVMIKQIAYEAELRQTTNVVVQVICVNKNGQSEARRTLTWSLIRRADGTWLLTGVAPGGDEYLCPPFGCHQLRAGE